MMEYGKTFVALVAAAAAGLWTGINYMGMLIQPPALGQTPAWVGRAEWMAYASLALLAVSVFAWIALDYRQRVHERG